LVLQINRKPLRIAGVTILFRQVRISVSQIRAFRDSRKKNFADYSNKDTVIYVSYI